MCGGKLDSVLQARQICAQYVYTSDVTTSENEGKKARKVRLVTLLRLCRLHFVAGEPGVA